MSENQQQSTVLTSNLLNNEKNLKVLVTYGDLRAEFSGSPEAVLNSISSFLAKHIPTLNLAQTLALNYSTAELVEGFKNFIRITPEGPRIITETELSDKEVTAIQLVGARIALDTGLSNSSSLTLSSLQELTALNPKSLSSRLSELTKDGNVVRDTGADGTTAFKITTQGINWLIETLSKKKGTAGKH